MALRDRLAAVGGKQAAHVAFAALDGIQTLPAADQVAGVWCLALTMAREAGLDISMLIDQTSRRFHDADTYHQREGKALVDYVKKEIR